jgi:hypothetical protein
MCTGQQLNYGCGHWEIQYRPKCIDSASCNAHVGFRTIEITEDCMQCHSILRKRDTEIETMKEILKAEIKKNIKVVIDDVKYEVDRMFESANHALFKPVVEVARTCQLSPTKDGFKDTVRLFEDWGVFQREVSKGIEAGKRKILRDLM